ncbi:MAG: TM0106 family RecB-like putative nuclease, partial [Vicinamibacterales bacterium]
MSNFLGCRHRTALDQGVALGKRQKPVWADPLLEALLARGLEHERNYIAELSSSGHKTIELRDLGNPETAIAATLEAMRHGADVIAQGALGDTHWFGRPDVLLRVATPSALGAWSYEVVDTKLALETRAGTILQLGLYCDLLTAAQGRAPEYFHVVTPDPESPHHTYRVGDYTANYRRVRRTLESFVEQDDDAQAAANYPEPVEHCEVCAWSQGCRDKRRRDDHLSLVAGITRVQRTELHTHQIDTTMDLAVTPVPLPFRPRRGSNESFVRVRQQARLQVESRGLVEPRFEPLTIEPDKGLCRLPPPSAGDLFLDLEGDPFAGEGGREYLFGIVSLDDRGRGTYHSRWALNETEEIVAFDEVMTIIMTSRAQHPGMHVYHYAPYEPTAFKRLMGRFAQREKDVDLLLRSGTFVDLYAVVRQGIRVGTERYSIKSLEPLYRFVRDVPLVDASRSLRTMEQALELGRPELVTAALRDVIQGYNEEDCRSALRLRDWLEDLRRRLEADGQTIPRPDTKEADAPESVT